MRKKLIPILLICAAVLLIGMGVLWYVLSTDDTPDIPPVEAASIPVETASPTPAVTEAPTPSPEESAAAEAVVRAYLERWNAKDAAGMEALLTPADRGTHTYDELQYEDRLEIGEIQALPQADAEARFASASLDASGEIALVEASFVVHYNAEGQDFYVRDTLQHEGYLFWLVMDGTDGDWRIALQGY